MTEKIPSYAEEEESTRLEPPHSKESTGSPDVEREVSVLKGKLFGQIEEKKREDRQELAKLRGSLLRVLDTEHQTENALYHVEELESSKDTEPFSPEWLSSQTFVQRDGGHMWVLEKFVDTKYGKRVRLRNLSTPAFLVRDLEDFTASLKMPGSAWSVLNKEA